MFPIPPDRRILPISLGAKGVLIVVAAVGMGVVYLFQ
jgi:hypothetical protein